MCETLSAIHRATFDPITKDMFFSSLTLRNTTKHLIEELSFISDWREKRAVCFLKE